MSLLDIFLAAILIYALYKGLINGLFVELASFLSLLLGIYLAIKCSHIVRETLANHVSWSPKYIEIFAFALTFIAVVVTIHLLAKILTGIMDFAFLGWINKLVGAFFSVLKAVLLLSVLFNLFEKVNFNNMLMKQETMDNSVLYNPIQQTSRFFYPTLEKWYVEFKEKHTAKPEEKTEEEPIK